MSPTFLTFYRDVPVFYGARADNIFAVPRGLAFGRRGYIRANLIKKSRHVVARLASFTEWNRRTVVADGASSTKMKIVIQVHERPLLVVSFVLLPRLVRVDEVD